jgi:molybdopterin converting factor small subunit
MFGRYAEIAGWRERELAPAPSKLSELVALLSAEEPALGPDLRGRWTLVTRNLEQVRHDVPLGPGDEVAFMPPMSGG